MLKPDEKSGRVAKNPMDSTVQEELNLTSSSIINISGDGTWYNWCHSLRASVCTVVDDWSGKVVGTELSTLRLGNLAKST